MLQELRVLSCLESGEGKKLTLSITQNFAYKYSKWSQVLGNENLD